MAKCRCNAHGSFLTAKGLEEAAQRFSLEGLAPRGVPEYLDNVVSVSASMGPLLHWPPDAIIEEQYRRFHNGS